MRRGRALRNVLLLVVAGFVLGGLVAFGARRGWNMSRASTPPIAEPESVSAAVRAAVVRNVRCTEPPVVSALAERVRRAEAVADELLAANLTARFLPPKDLPVRFDRMALEEAVYNSIAAAGVEADVMRTDCSEYPCLVIGRAHSAADMQKIKDHFFEQPGYAGDMKQLARGRGEERTEHWFGAMAYPSTEPRQAEIRAALTRRLGVARLGPGAVEKFRRPGIASTIGADLP